MVSGSKIRTRSFRYYPSSSSLYQQKQYRLQSHHFTSLEDSEVSQQQRAVAVTAADLVSDDDRSVAADSWSINSDYGSTLDDEQRHADAAEALSNANFRSPCDYSFDKDEDTEAATSMLGLQSYWNATYADELANFDEHGHAGIC